MVTAATERWEELVEVECLHCGGPTPSLPVCLGVEIGDGVLCTPCFHRVYYGDLSLARQALAPEPDGEDGGPAPSPAAPAARPVRPFSVATWTGAPVYLTAEEQAEWDAFEQAACETADPLPCAACGRPASPAIETDAGTYCLTCGEGPDAPPEALAAVRDLRLRLTCQRIACARVSRQLAAVR